MNFLNAAGPRRSPAVQLNTLNVHTSSGITLGMWHNNHFALIILLMQSREAKIVASIPASMDASTVVISIFSQYQLVTPLGGLRIKAQKQLIYG